MSRKGKWKYIKKKTSGKDRIKTKKEQKVLNSILGYASSQSELSAPYIKLSDE